MFEDETRLGEKQSRVGHARGAGRAGPLLSGAVRAGLRLSQG